MVRRAWSRRNRRLSLVVAPWVASGLMRVLAGTLRRTDIGREHPEACWGRGERGIVSFWHGRLLMMPFAYPGTPGTILISQHWDGEYIARIAERLGFSVARGSATRGGARAFRHLVQTVRAERNVVITLDGSKGPRRQVKSGVIELFRLSGMPILPVGFGAWPRTLLRSWDEFLIPHPFARGVFVWGEPLYVPPALSKTEGQKFQAILAERLDKVTVEADGRATGERRMTKAQ